MSRAEFEPCSLQQTLLIGAINPPRNSTPHSSSTAKNCQRYENKTIQERVTGLGSQVL
jgi:hypothetical protein